uniref:Uncharacterized protein n=1 Tax=Candidatus Kentrum sp. FW TaxID=2126338 RepID=A0A450TPW4_9GAMM|nr:MAG: hypothetical protein BECKFW1821A_GA0114235_11612 [Candidatus Kentron sp. FW]VFJ70050.1 MAG: hypothetical protein BECKFW1821B_GA0114236_11782 [Candidatus Kentron sp. FW]
MLTEFGTLMESVMSRDDTRLALGGEVMRQATQVYDYVKTTAEAAHPTSSPWPISWANWKVTK